MCQKVSILVVLCINLIINLVILSFLFIITNNIKLLKAYQKTYLAFSIIIWLLICITYFAKVVAYPIVEFYKKFNYNDNIKKILIWVWVILNSGAYLMMLIGFIYDIVILLKDGRIARAAYFIVYLAVCFIYIILSLFDFFFIDYYIKLYCLIKIDKYASLRLQSNEGNKEEKEDEKEDEKDECVKTKKE